MNSYFDEKLIELMYPGAGPYMFPPMLIHKAESTQLKKASDSGKYFGEIKNDGALYYAVVTDYQTYLFGRTVSVKNKLLTEKSSNVPHIIKVLNTLPVGTVILGELYYPGKSSKDVTSIMGCLPKKAIERQEGAYGYLTFYIYDCLYYNGQSLLDKTNWERYKVVEAIYNKFLSSYPYIELAEAYEDNLYERIGDALANNEEGMVLKLKNGLYEPGKRPLTNLKAKQVDYIDAVVLGFNNPTKEYSGKDIKNWVYWADATSGVILTPPTCLYTPDYKELGIIPVTKPWYFGWKNSIEIGAYDGDSLINIGSIASGLTDELREDFSKNPDKYLNKVCKIQCMSLDKERHTIRHGFFRGWHEDKNPIDCKIGDIF